MEGTNLRKIMVAIKGAGEMATAVAWRLFMANIRRIFMMEVPNPLAVRRGVSFCEAVHEGQKEVEGVCALRVDGPGDFHRVWKQQKIALIVDPQWDSIREVRPHVVVDAILAKRNLGTSIQEAPLVIALGPGFEAGRDVHFVIETNRGHNLGRVIDSGGAEPNTGIPGQIEGYSWQRVLRAPTDGVFISERSIGDLVREGEEVGMVGDQPVVATIGGVLRGLIRPGIKVRRGLKLGDIDPRAQRDYCWTISDKARSIAGGVLEAILRVHNTP